MIKNLISMRRHREAIWKMDKENHESLLRSIGWKSEMSNLIIEE